MKVAVLLAALAGFVPQEEVATYRNDALGLSFNHPKSWKVESKREDAIVTIPLPSGGTAQLYLFALQYREPPEIWSLAQKQMDHQMRRETLRQWQEEILGVPLLLSKSQESVGGGARVTLSGLMYSATPRKFSFRLVAPAEGYDEAEFLFRQALQTLRTLDGSLPSAEDPNRPPADPKAAAQKPPPKPPKVVVLAGSVPPPIRAASSVPARAGGKQVELWYPSGWTAEAKSETEIALRHPDLKGEVEVVVASTLDSDPPRRALLVASLRSLEPFKKVTSREETIPKRNRAGASVAYVLRLGEGASGALASFDAYGAGQEHYWLLRWKKQGEPLSNEERKLLFDLIERMSVEPKG